MGLPLRERRNRTWLARSFCGTGGLICCRSLRRLLCLRRRILLCLLRLDLTTLRSFLDFHIPIHRRRWWGRRVTASPSGRKPGRSCHVLDDERTSGGIRVVWAFRADILT